MDLIQDIKEESLDIDNEDLDSSEVRYPQNLLHDEVITDDVPTQETWMPVPVKLVVVSRGKEMPFQVSIKQEDAIDVHCNYQEGMGDSQEVGEAVLPKDELIEESLLFSDVKEEEQSAEGTEGGFKVFAESIVADNLEEEEDKGGKSVELTTGCYNKEMQKRKLNHFEDEYNLQTSNGIRYVNYTRHGKEHNLATILYLQDYGAQLEKGKHATDSTSAMIRSECEDIETMESKEEENDQCNIEENEEESNRSKEREEENTVGLSEPRRIKIVEWANETCLSSKREDGFKCHNCGDWMETKEEMSAHIQLMHAFSSGKNKYPKNDLTKNCNKKRHKEELGEHLRVYSRAKRHICSICDKRFGLKTHLITHIRIHTGEKPFKCSICDYRCAHKGYLRTHMRTHTGEKPYKCSICDYRCTQNQCLKAHMRIHSGDRPYKCTICNRKFKQNGSLKAHMRIHTGEKPHECSICGYRCSRMVALRLHMQFHGGEKPYKCSVCEFGFSEKEDLKIHMVIHNR